MLVWYNYGIVFSQCLLEKGLVPQLQGPLTKPNPNYSLRLITKSRKQHFDPNLPVKIRNVNQRQSRETSPNRLVLFLVLIIYCRTNIARFLGLDEHAKSRYLLIFFYFKNQCKLSYIRPNMIRQSIETH